MPTLERAYVEGLVGRPLRPAEQVIDVVKLDRALSKAKDQVDRAISKEMLRATLEWLRGLPDGRIVLHTTQEMTGPLARLTDLGRSEAWKELQRAGYDTSGSRRLLERIEQFPGDRDPHEYLRRNLTVIGLRIRDELVHADLTGLAATAVADALLRVPGGRDIASRIVSTSLMNGMADTFDQVADLVVGWEYTAVLDGGTCEICAPLDGTTYDTLDELFGVLPDFGPNPDCFGGGRCRCRAVPLPA